MQDGDWNSALQKHYDVQTLGELQVSWVKWVNADERALRAVIDTPVLQATSVSPIIISAKPLPPPKSVYDRHMDKQFESDGRVETIPANWNDEKPILIPVSYGREVVLR